MTAHRIEPYVLFDPAREGPPPDAIDLQVRLPRSMQVWADDLARAGRRDELLAVRDLVEGLVPELVRETQSFCGRVVHRDPRLTDARLAVTAVPEGGVPGYGARVLPHVHLYIGATARVLREGDRTPGGGRYRPEETGESAPVDVDAVNDGASYVDGCVVRAVNSAAERWGLTLSYDLSGLREIVDPPGLVERALAQGYVTCPGPWGPRRLVLADAITIRLAEQYRSEEKLRRGAYQPSSGPSS